MFFWNSLAFSMIQRMLAIWSLVPLPFLKPAWTSGSSRFTYCWSLAWRILSVTLTLQHIKKQRHYFANKGPSSQSYGFSSSHVWIWELDYKESWVLKNWCFWTMVLKTLESPLDYKEIQPVHPKGNQSWIFIGRTDVEAETPILWPLNAKNWLIWKDLDAGKDWRQKEVTTEDEMVGWHHQLKGLEFEQGLGIGDGKGSLVCCSSWGSKESDTTERVNRELWYQDQVGETSWHVYFCVLIYYFLVIKF